MKKLMKALFIALVGIYILSCNPIEASASNKIEITGIISSDTKKYEKECISEKQIKEGKPKLKKNKDGSYTLVVYDFTRNTKLQLSNVPKDKSVYYTSKGEIYSKVCEPKDKNSKGRVFNIKYANTRHEDDKANKPSRYVGYLQMFTDDNSKYIGKRTKLTIIVKQIPSLKSRLRKLMKDEMGYKKSLCEFDRAFRAYLWCRKNIKYKKHTSGVAETIRKGYGVCQEQTNLFIELCNAMDIEAIYIRDKEKDHAWPAVKIDGKLYIVKSGWGLYGYSFYDSLNDFAIPLGYPTDSITRPILLKGYKNVARKLHPRYKEIVSDYEDEDALKDEDNINAKVKEQMNKKYGEGTYEEFLKLERKIMYEGENYTEAEEERYDYLNNIVIDVRDEVVEEIIKEMNKIFSNKWLKDVKGNYL